jgi:hypothetical protein
LELVQKIYLSKGIFNHPSLKRIPLKPDETDKVTKASHITEEGYFFVLLENATDNFKLTINLKFDPIFNLKFITPPTKKLPGGKTEFDFVLDKNNKR